METRAALLQPALIRRTARRAVLNGRLKHACCSRQMLHDKIAQSFNHTFYSSGINIARLIELPMIYLISQLAAAGFRDIDAVDMTEDWARLVASRLVAFESDRARYVRVHGTPAYDALHMFYAEVVRFYDSGTLGGVRILACLL
jgi:hypothetical protein